MIERKGTFGISEKSFKIILDTLTKFSEIKKAVIFGSRALGNAKPGSDVDIAIFGEKMTDDILRRVNLLLNEKENIPYFIDILNFEDIQNDELKKHILEFGKILKLKKNNENLLLGK